MVPRTGMPRWGTTSATHRVSEGVQWKAQEFHSSRTWNSELNRAELVDELLSSRQKLKDARRTKKRPRPLPRPGQPIPGGRDSGCFDDVSCGGCPYPPLGPEFGPFRGQIQVREGVGTASTRDIIDKSTAPTLRAGQGCPHPGLGQGSGSLVFRQTEREAMLSSRKHALQDVSTESVLDCA